MASSKEGVIRMFNCRMVDVFNLQAEDVVPINFIHALSLINRYTGATPWPVSVMQHSLMLEQHIKERDNDLTFEQWQVLLRLHGGEHGANEWMRDDLYQLRRAAFIHDWSEALFNDLASPVKRNFVGYQQHELRAQKVIFSALGVDIKYLDRVHPYDKSIYLDEVNSTWGLERRTAEYEGRKLEPLGVTYTEQPWRDIRAQGIAKYKELFPRGPYLGAVVL
jgi:hypothetical protein